MAFADELGNQGSLHQEMKGYELKTFLPGSAHLQV